MASGQKPFYIALGVVVVGGGVFIATKAGSGHPVSIPANVVVTVTDTTGFRGYFIGSADAPVEIAEFAVYQCPHCAVFDQVQYPELKARLIDNSKARLRFRDFPIEGAQSRTAAHAAACANDQGHFADYKEALFRRQSDWAFHPDPMPVMDDIAKGIGVVAKDFDDCMQSAKYAGRIQASFDEGTKLGVNATPSFLIGGRIYNSTSSDEMVKIVDSLIATLPRPKAGAPKTSGGL